MASFGRRVIARLGLAEGVLLLSDGRVVGGEEHPGPGVLGHRLEVVLEGEDLALPQLLERVLLAEGVEGVDDRHVDVVVGPAGLDRRLRDRRHLLVPARGEERAEHQVVGPLGVLLPVDGLLARRGPPPCTRPGCRGSRPGRPSPPGAAAGASSPCGRPPVSARARSSSGRSCSGTGRRPSRWRRRRGRSSGSSRDRVLEHLEGELEVLAGEAPRVAPAPEVQVVGLEVLGRLRRQVLLLLGAEGHAQRLGDLAGDLVLDLEDVLHLAVVALRPEREVGAGRRPAGW